MRPSTEARTWTGVLVALQLLTSLTGVAMLGRMTPAIERIISENVVSTEAVEDMLAAMASGGDVARFEAAYARARGNITEEAEGPLLDAIDRLAPAALGGDPVSMSLAVDKLRALSQVNRASMEEADRNASRLGLAGAWAMALMGFVAFLVSLVVVRRVELRLIEPILEVDRVLADVREGDRHRRCTAFSSVEAGERLKANLNWVLDRHTVPTAVVEDRALRACVVALLDRIEAPALVAGPDGTVVAQNQSALGALVGDGSAAAVAKSVAMGGAPAGWAVTALREGLVLVVRAA